MVNETPDKIKLEIKRLKAELGSGGGFIIGSGLTILKDVPLNNLISMIEEIIV